MTKHSRLLTGYRIHLYNWQDCKNKQNILEKILHESKDVDKILSLFSAIDNRNRKRIAHANDAINSHKRYKRTYKKNPK